MNKIKPLTVNEVILFLMKVLENNYFKVIFDEIDINPNLKNTIAGLIINPDVVTIYMGKEHIAVEFSGSEILRKDFKERYGFEVRFFDCSLNDGTLLENILGFDKSYSNRLSPPILGNV